MCPLVAIIGYLRFYGYHVNELVNPEQPHLDMEIDPKLNWALGHLDQFPLDINTADQELIKRVPGIGVQSAAKIVAARKFSKLSHDQLKKMGIAYNRAKYFLSAKSPFSSHKDYTPVQIREQILQSQNSKYVNNFSSQLSLF
jgi:predicted DNA-binding helix-hairpin-helix protein